MTMNGPSKKQFRFTGMVPQILFYSQSQWSPSPKNSQSDEYVYAGMYICHDTKNENALT